GANRGVLLMLPCPAPRRTHRRRDRESGNRPSVPRHRRGAFLKRSTSGNRVPRQARDLLGTGRAESRAQRGPTRTTAHLRGCQRLLVRARRSRWPRRWSRLRLRLRERQALIERAARDGEPLIEREQIADFFDWYRLEIEAVARAKLEAGVRGVGEHDVMV